jgi:hypothetical protein
MSSREKINIYYHDDPESPYDSSALRLYYGIPRYSGWYYSDVSIGTSYGPYKSQKKARVAGEKYLKEKEFDYKNNAAGNKKINKPLRGKRRD